MNIPSCQKISRRVCAIRTSVSYTHLDVYKRQELQAETRKAPDKPTEARTAPAVPPGEYLSTGLQRDGAFRALWEGGRPNGNESADDLALMNKLAFWCGRDAARMKAAFLASPHAAGKDEAHRKKLEREDYLQRTIDRAVKDCPETAAERDAAYKLDRCLLYTSRCV